MILVGLAVYGFVHFNRRIAPGYYHVMDFEGYETARMKPYCHFDTYFSGVLMAIMYLETL